MSLRFISSAMIAVVCMISTAAPSSADILLNYEGGNSGNLSDPGEAIEFTGSSVLLSSFNWYSGSGASETAYAYGTLYIIPTTSAAINSGGYDSGYTSTAASLETNAIASATASNNVYTFSPGVVLNSGTTYYFFVAGTTGGEDASGSTETNTGDAAANITRYRVPGSNVAGYPDFVSGTGSNDFQLTGTLVPEPSSLAMVGTGGLAWLAYAFRARRRPERKVGA